MLLLVEAQPLLTVLLPHFTQLTTARMVMLTAAWYGGTRRVAVVSGTGDWYTSS